MADRLMFLSQIIFYIGIIYYIWLLFCGIISIFIKKPDPLPYRETGNELRTAVLIAARNEESVIGNLLDSFHSQNYPKDKYRLFVVAHNCTDSTAEVAEKHGAEVFVYNNPEERWKGFAVNRGVQCLREKYPDDFDAICFFDADNIAGRNFLYEITSSLAAGADVAQGYRASKNHYKNWITEQFAFFWISIFCLHYMPIDYLNLSSTVCGTGFAARTSALSKEGWFTYTLLEDVEFSVQQILSGHKIVTNPNAIFYDEQPEKLKPAILQRYRWTVGGTQLFFRYAGSALAYIKEKPLIGLRVVMDVFCNFFLFFLAISELLKIFAILSTGASLSALLLTFAKDAMGSWALLLIFPICVIYSEKMSLRKNLRTLLLLPFFLALNIILCFISLFFFQTSWPPIPHRDQTTIDDLEP